MLRMFSAHGGFHVGESPLFLLTLLALWPQPSEGQFSTQVKQDFQNIYDLVFAESRCRDRERCTMMEWDYVKELTNDLDETYIGPKVIEQPRNFYFNKENKDPLHFASFVCKATEDMDSISFYKWYRNNVEIQVANPENSHISMAGGRLDINNPTEKDEGGYHCSASNLAGTSISRTRNLYAAFVGEFNQVEREETVSANRVAVISCEAPKEFFRRLDYFWKRQVLLENGTLLEEEEFIEQSNRFIIDENNGNLYMIKPHREDLNRVYRCVVRNEKEYEQETGSYDFIEGPKIHVRMSQDLPNLNDLSIRYPTVSNMEYRTRSTRNITMYCIADGGYDLLTYSWTVPNPEVGNYFFRYQGAKLEIIGAQLENNGDYQCSVRNQDREVTMTMKLFVYERPRITKHVEDHQARISQEFTLSCEASGEPAPAYRWYYQGKPIQPGLGRSPNGNALAFINVQEAASGMYQCEAYNEHGNAVSTAQLMVEEVEPIFVNQFGSRVDEKQVFEVGYPGKLHCRPFAIPIPVFSWSFQGQSISNGTKYQMWLDGTLFLTQVNKDDNGDYKCIAQGGSNSESMKFSVVVIPRVDLQVSEEKQTTLVNRTLDLECALGSDNPDEGHFVWLLDGKELQPSPGEKMQEIESFYRRLDSKFGSDDPGYILRTADKQQALQFKFPYFSYSSPDQNPFYPSAGPGKFSRSNAGVRSGLSSEEQLREVNLWDPHDPYKTKEQYKQELEAEEAVVLKYFGTDISWYAEPLFNRREDLHYVMVGDGEKKGTLRIYRAQKWQQGTYTCCYMTLYGDTCKDTQVSVIGLPPRPANVHFDSRTKRLSWGSPQNSRSSEDNLPIDKFVIQMETIALYPVPEFMQPYPLDDTYSTPDPFFTIEAAFLPARGFQNITETDGDKSSVDLSSFVKKYCMLRFRVVALNALGESAPSLSTRGDLMPQGPPTELVNNIQAGFAERAKKKRLLAISFDPVNVADFAADNCYFNVFYRKTGSGSSFINQKVRSPFQNQMTIELPSDSARDASTLDDYDVQIQIVNELGEGPMSPIVVIKEVPLAPQLKVTNVKSTPTSSTSVLITFTGIDLSKEPTFFGYQVEFFKYSEEDFDLTNNNYEVTSGNATQYTEVHVFDLEPAMNYKFHVKVINKGGVGPPSEQVFGETFMAEPSAQPQNVNVYTYKDNTVRVTWDPVEVTEGEAQLDGYRIFYWEYGIPDNESAYYEWRRNAERDEEVFIRDIQEGQRYNVIVQPVSEGGFGIRSEPFPFLMRTTHYNWLFQSISPKFEAHALLFFSCFTISLVNYFILT